jgi:hypothetical protein
MRLICAWCPDCIGEHGKSDGDSCPFHFPSQVSPENAAVGFLCEHHHIKLTKTPAKTKRKPRPPKSKRKKK